MLSTTRGAVRSDLLLTSAAVDDWSDYVGGVSGFDRGLDGALPADRWVLVVDDEPDVRETLKNTLAMEGYSVETASHGHEALERMRDRPVGLVLTDIRMPGMDGLALLQSVKSLDETVEVIVLTGYGTVENAVAALKQEGAFDFLQKPLHDVEHLITAVNRAVERRALRLKNEQMLVALRKLSSAVEHSASMLTIIGKSGAIEYVNPRYTEVTGYSPASCIGRTDWLFDDGPAGADAHPEIRDRLAAGLSWQGELQSRKQSGEVFWEAATISPIRDERAAITHFVKVSEDITERKRTEAALIASERFNAAILEAISYPVLVLDERGEIVTANAAWNALIQSNGAVASAGKNYLDCCRRFLLDGGAGAATADEILAGIEGVIAGRSDRYEAQVQCRLGPVSRWFLIQVTQLAPDSRQTLVCQVDITLLKEMEDRLVHHRKMEAVATLAAGIAHEYNNALAAVMGNADLINLKINDHPAIRRYLRGILEGCKRMQRLSSRLLTHVRGGHSVGPAVSVRSWLPETIDTFTNVISRGIRIEVDGEDMDTAMKGDPLQLQIMLNELVKNAAESINGGDGRIRIGIQDAPERGAVRISVSDNGRGMDEQTRSRIFEPFFTSNFIGRGVGMAVVYGIVQSHGGKIDVRSVPGEGTRVEILIPAIGELTP